MIFCLTTDPKAADPTNSGLKALSNHFFLDWISKITLVILDNLSYHTKLINTLLTTFGNINSLNQSYNLKTFTSLQERFIMGILRCSKWPFLWTVFSKDRQFQSLVVFKYNSIPWTRYLYQIYYQLEARLQDETGLQYWLHMKAKSCVCQLWNKFY